MTTLPLYGKLRRPDQRHIPILATLSLLALMYGAGVVNYDGFSDTQVFLNLFINNTTLLVVAVGLTFVILTGGIDLSVGAVVALTSVMAATLLKAGWPAGIVLPVVLLIGTSLGLAMGAIIHYFDIPPFIVTLAGLFLARGLANLIARSSIPITNETWISIGQRRVEMGAFSITVTALFSLLVVAIAAYVLAYTRFGRNVYAIGGNAQSALLMGLPVGRTRIGVYTLSGFCASLGGLLVSFDLLSGYSLHASGLELDAIAAVVIGGTLLSGGSGFVVGSLFGVLVYGLIQTILTFQGNLTSWWTRIVIGALLFVFILLQRLVTRRRS